MLCFCKLAKGLCTILWPVVWHYDIWDAMCGENLLECFYDLVRSLIREFLNVKPHWVIVNHDDVFSSLQPLSGAGWEGQGHKWISGRWLFLSTCEASGGHHTEVHALDQHLVRPRRPVWMQSRIFSRILLGTSIRSSYRCRSSRIVRWLRFSQYRYCNGDTNACLIDFLLGFAPNPNTVLIIDEGVTEVSQVGNKLSKMVYHPHKLLYPGNIWRNWDLGHSSGRLHVCVESRAINDVSEESNWRSSKPTFVIKGQPTSCRRWRTARTRPSCSDWSTLWLRTSSIWQSVPSESSSIWDIVRWKISGAELIPNGSLLKQKHPKPTLGVHFWEDLTVSEFSEVLIHWRHRVYLTLDSFVKVSQVNTDTHTAIWFKDRNDTCTPFSWCCYRRDHSLLKHCFYLSFYLWNQWMGNLSWIVETEGLGTRAKCYVAFSPQLSQSTEERWKFSFEICWPRVHLFDIFFSTSYEP